MHRREMLRRLSVLTGGTLSLACQQALAVPPAERAAARVYSQEQGALVARLADLIIPTTDTPGAAAAGVGEFIDYVVAAWYSKDERARFVAGLEALETTARESHGKAFLALDENQQTALLGALAADEVLDINANFGTGDFFAQLKEMTVVGYYTSEIGATQERSYVPMPGKYDGHFKFDQVGRQWAS